MAFDPTNFNPTGFAADFSELAPIFHVEPVQLQFSVASDFAAVQVANNVIILALVSGRILRIDLANPQDVDDIDLPRKPSEVGTIRKVFLDPTASHLIIGTTHGENYYLHSRSTKPRHLSRLKSVLIDCVAWSPALPSTSTREILIGAQDGSVYETYIEGLEESFMRREEKYTKLVYKSPEGQPITGLWVDNLPGKPELRRVILTSPGAIMHWVGRIQRYGHGDIASIFAKFFESEGPSIQDFRDNSMSYSMLAISPEETADDYEPERIFAWVTAPGIYHGKLLLRPTDSELGAHVFSTSKLFSKSGVPSGRSPITSIALTQYHIIVLCGTEIYAINRLDDSIVFQEVIAEPGTKVLGLCSDVKKSTFWAFTSSNILEIEVIDEDRDVWKIYLADKSFEAAMRFAKTPAQKDQVAVAHGDYLTAHGKYIEAAEVYGGSSKSFEEVALTFLENGEHDALRKYLLVKLANLKKTSVMQRIMVASWLIEIFMSRLNSLEDALSTITSHKNASVISPDTIRAQLSDLREEYHEFVNKYKSDLDRKTTYEIISSHGRQYELLYYANSVNDYSYVLAYWVQREKWLEALDVLKRQSDPDVFYKYSSVLMANVAMQTVDILMRQSNLKPRNLIPALLNYNKFTAVPLNQNQAVRYLLFVIHQLGSSDAAVHNTLISIYASHPSSDETQLLRYLEEHTGASQYDSDFALRLCIQHGHVQSCVHIYSSMGQYADAVELALKHGNVELASVVADRPEDDPTLRKKLWLSVAKKVIAQSDSIKSAIEFLRRCELLKIEDLIPFFPDFVVIDDFKEEICTALEDYSHNIDQLKKEMDESARTAEHIRSDIASLDRRYAIVEPGERCYVCQYPLLSRQFFVFPCQHAFHSDCLTTEVTKHSGIGKNRRIEDLQRQIQQGIVTGKKREKAVEDLDNMVASECILCSDFAIKRIDEPFVLPSDDLAEWAV
ncbi:Pep3/Vps18/deep orange family-domain-containing protein [Geopyxis carbonaria]|nr:Pep3/Vps18/deep orange family-domain-containing protein [Geopyxis carbonaria]